jgi:hypothetical protein
MRSPYLPLFDHTKEMSTEERRRVGLVTAALLLRQQEWFHRRVEQVTYEDIDLMRRRNSVDFTIPEWALDILGAKTKPINVAVPISLFRKDTLVHFNLNDEHGAAAPLFLGPQAAQLAELALLATAELALNNGNLPSTIVDGIKEVADAAPSEARQAQERLYAPKKTYATMRQELEQHSIFRALVKSFIENYIAAVLLPTRRGERRVIHFAYDEPRQDITYGGTRRLEVALGMLTGRRSYNAYIFSSAGDAASYHIEAEAPEGLRISSRETVSGGSGRQPDQKVGSFKRVHLHYSKLASGSRLAIVLRISPRSSTILRVAAMTSVLTFLAVLFTRIEVGDIVNHRAIDGMAVLLSIPTLLSVYVLRSDEHPATTHILWPIRVVATAPGVLAFAAAAVLASGGSAEWSTIVLDVLSGLLALSTWILMLTWRRAARHERQRRS